MPEGLDRDHEAYKEPPKRTPAPEEPLSPFHPLAILGNVLHYTVDAPVTVFRDWMERQRGKHKFYYYHRNYRRVPDLTECLEGDYLCMYEAEAQWKRDMKVDYEIVKIIKERAEACQVREGPSHRQNCAKEMEQFAEVSKAFADRYADLGAFGSARKCLMKQKHRMIAERKAEAKQ
ncbi:NADH dehydrogenase [ubiquinone] 1 beta subcomplex subunit 10 [Emydura macquarii macquarii]|uniref:NADH dehydrogenase [ubiquinone] 1 beta subcomplex subunit 10 n=1 Tax=Emydura macquarii macquarii TaxID=1129001 RepID=UPI00352B8C95